MKKANSERNEIDEHLDGDAAVAKIRELLPSFQTTMLITRKEEGGALHVRPMGMLGDPTVFGGTLWFITDDRSRKLQEIRNNPSVTLVFQNDQSSRYLQLEGNATVVSDKAKMRELYTPLMKAWFPRGLEDPNMTLLRVDAHGGSFWDNPGGMIRILAALTKSVVTGRPGKSGDTGVMSIS